MKRLEKLIRVSRYLSAFRPDGCGDSLPVLAVETGDATAKLARLSGDRVLIAYPELKQEGDSDTCATSVSGAFFVLTKMTPAGVTPDTEREAFARLLEIVSAILDRLASDTCSGCELLAGLSLHSVTVAPESSVFGGWSGWSIDVTLR